MERERERDRPYVPQSINNADQGPMNNIKNNMNSNNSSNGRNNSGSADSHKNSDEVTLRCLVCGTEAGIVIGKKGQNIRSIRERTSARVFVSANVQGATDRILSITGTVDEVAKAYAQVARNFNEGSLRGSTNETVESTPLTFRFLISHSRMGGVIGQKGARIKEIQEESNARLVASQGTLPNSGDRVLNMTGVPDAIHIATYHMLVTIRSLADRPCNDRPYRPEYAVNNQMMGFNMNTHNHMMPAMHSMPHHGGHMGNHQYNGIMQGVGGNMNTYGNMGHQRSGVKESRKFMCPVRKVGSMIGKNGSRINHIRSSTNCTIDVEENVDMNGERAFVIQGYSHEVDSAIRMMENFLKRDIQRDNDNITAVAANTQSNNVSNNNMGMSSGQMGVESNSGDA